MEYHIWNIWLCIVLPNPAVFFATATGALAEQAVMNLQKILQTTSKFQPISAPTPKLISPQTNTSMTVSGTEQDTSFSGEDGGYYSTPSPSKRFCPWVNIDSSLHNLTHILCGFLPSSAP